MTEYNLILFFKAIHIIGFVCWFAALFYLPRLFIYHREALDMDEPKKSTLVEQFSLMERRLYNIIMTPAMVITLIGGFTMLHLFGWDYWTTRIWLHWKLGFILLLLIYHFYCKNVMISLGSGQKTMTSIQFRIFNEIPTLFLLAIILLAVYKSRLIFIYTLGGLLIFSLALGIGIKYYKKIRNNH
ncbi:MAG: protoporphyrinogen oxidase HemJ [Saprospiraceae bacterium]|nr:protoporphyrinogen oxidase HemJ [Saprospiraceae bacterium]